MKLFDKLNKNQLDEMQEQKMLKVEHNGCWLAFWGLFALLMVEVVLTGGDPKVLGGEWLVFMILAVYLSIGSLKAGVWSRVIKPSVKTNVIGSLCGSVTVSFVMWLVGIIWFESPLGALFMGLVSGTVTFVLTMALLQISMRAYKKRTEALEQEEDDDGNEK